MKTIEHEFQKYEISPFKGLLKNMAAAARLKGLLSN